jgi:hypothetical protein
MAEKLEKSKWRGFFDGMTNALIGKSAEIEIAALPIGHQIEGKTLPLNGITYDHKDDLVLISSELDVDHMIRRPRDIYIEEGPTGLENVLIVDADGVQHMVKLRLPLMLPAPSTAAS